MARRTPISTAALSFWAAGFLVLIIVGIALLTFQPNLHPSVLAFRLALIVVGCAGLVIITVLSLHHGANPRELARQILEQQKSLYSAPHDFGSATMDEFPDLDRAYYDQLQSELESNGFSFLDDVENLSLTRALPAFRTLIRILTGDHAGTVARIYQVRPLGQAGRDIRILELMTELSDFSFICTTNGELFTETTDIHGIRTTRLPPASSVQEVLDRHRQTLAEFLAQNPSLQLVPCPTLEDVLKSARHAHAVRSVHRKRHGYVNKEDLKLIRGEPLTPLDDQIFEHISQLESSERAA